jgi:hypothetical protein
VEVPRNGRSADSDLTAKARDAIRAGKVPDRLPDRTFGGCSRGALCAICDELVQRDESEFEIEFFRDDVASDRYVLHAACFWAWRLERQEPAAEMSVNGRRVGPAPADASQLPPGSAASCGSRPSLPPGMGSPNILRRGPPANEYP